MHKPQDSLTLVSPNGRFKVTISATDNGAAIWLTEEGANGLVSIYNGFNQGQVVGLGDPFKAGGYPLAMGVKDDVPNIQYVEKDKKLEMVRLGELPKKSKEHVHEHCCNHNHEGESYG